MSEVWEMKKIRILPWLLALLMMAPVALAQGHRAKIEPSFKRPLKLKKLVAPTAQGVKPVKQSGPAPVIACDGADYDFGSVSQGDVVQHVFRIKNKGKGVLNIQRARGG